MLTEQNASNASFNISSESLFSLKADTVLSHDEWDSEDSGGGPWGWIKQSFSCLVQITEYLSPKWLLSAFKTRSVPSGEGQFPKLARCLVGFHSSLECDLPDIHSLFHTSASTTQGDLREAANIWMSARETLTQLEMCSGPFSPSSHLRCSCPGTYSFLGQYPSEELWNYPAWLGKHICHFSFVTDFGWAEMF